MAHLPPLIQSAIDARLAWQRPKAIICAVLLVALVALSIWLWRTLIRRSGRGRLLLIAGSLSAAACFVLMLMVIGNTEYAIHPITVTYLYG